MADARAEGTIYDLGFQRYEGVRLGRANAIRTLADFSFRAAFGVGRGERARLIPVIVAAFCFLPVIIQVGGAAASGNGSFISFGQHLQMVSFFLALFAAAQAPELIVMDRQQGVLALYLSRSLRSTDYALAKLAALVGAMLILTLGPELALFAGKTFVSETPWQAFKDDWQTLIPIVGGTTLISVYMASVGLSLSSLTSRRAFGSAAVISFFILLPAIAGIAASIVSKENRKYAVLGNPFVVMLGFTGWLFDVQGRRRSIVVRTALSGDLYFYTIIATCVLAIAVLMWRHRKAEA